MSNPPHGNENSHFQIDRTAFTIPDDYFELRLLSVLSSELCCGFRHKYGLKQHRLPEMHSRVKRGSFGFQPLKRYRKPWQYAGGIVRGRRTMRTNHERNTRD